MIDKITCAGYGGQGVVLAGSLIANAAMEQGLHTCGMVSYGVEMRGGTANSTAIISDKPIGSPVVVNPSTAIIMNQPSLERFEPLIQKKGLIILNTSECRVSPARKDLNKIGIEATRLAEQLGNKKVANLILVGAYIGSRNILNIKSAFQALPIVLKGKEQLIGLNRKALEIGYGEVNVH